MTVVVVSLCFCILCWPKRCRYFDVTRKNKISKDNARCSNILSHDGIFFFRAEHISYNLPRVYITFSWHLSCAMVLWRDFLFQMHMEHFYDVYRVLTYNIYSVFMRHFRRAAERGPSEPGAGAFRWRQAVEGAGGGWGLGRGTCLCLSVSLSSVSVSFSLSPISPLLFTCTHTFIYYSLCLVDRAIVLLFICLLLYLVLYIYLLFIYFIYLVDDICPLFVFIYLFYLPFVFYFYLFILFYFVPLYFYFIVCLPFTLCAIVFIYLPLHTPTHCICWKVWVWRDWRLGQVEGGGRRKGLWGFSPHGSVCVCISLNAL